MVTPPQRPPGAPDPAELDALAADLTAGGVALERDAPLGPLTTYRVGGRASILVTASSADDVGVVASAVARHRPAVLAVGRGSNLLVADTGFAGLVVRLVGELEAIEIDASTVRAGAAALLPVVARRTVAAGLSGFEWAVGIPGSVGGGVRMNAGGHGSDVASTIDRALVADLRSGSVAWRSSNELGLVFRGSALADEEIVLAAEFELGPDPDGGGERRLAEIVRWRRENQPGGQNGGSVFVNPPGDSAGRLVDTAGCRGLRMGTAEVSPKHANFIVADPDGRAGDVYALMLELRRRVEAVHGIRLRSETVLVGFDDALYADYDAPGHDRHDGHLGTDQETS